MARKNKSSARRLAANRQNALKSTGPRTPEGKAKSAQNAATHHLANPLSPAHFLHTESEPQFQALFASYLATYQPQHRDEYDLLTEAVYAKWRQQRLWAAETAQLEIAMARHEAALQKELPRADPAAHLANGIAHSADLLRLYQRYNAQLHRQYLRCLDELRRLQAERSPLEPHLDGPQAAPTHERGPIPPQPADTVFPNEPTEPAKPLSPNHLAPSPAPRR